MAVSVWESARPTRAAAWKCFGLTTADRPERETHVRSELVRAALPFEVLVAERPADAGGFASIGFRGCFESHLRALRAARDEGVDVAVLVEDDVVVASRFLGLLPELQQELQGREWSILLLGYLGGTSPARHFPLDPVSPHLARATHWELTGSHFVAINATVLDELIADFERRLLPGGHRISVDGVYNEFRRDRGDDTLVCVPNLGRQAPSPSGTSTQVGLRTRLLKVPALQRTLLAIKRTVWDAEAMLPPQATLRSWNVRARLTAAQAAQYAEPTTGHR